MEGTVEGMVKGREYEDKREKIQEMEMIAIYWSCLPQCRVPGTEDGEIEPEISSPEE